LGCEEEIGGLMKTTFFKQQIKGNNCPICKKRYYDQICLICKTTISPLISNIKVAPKIDTDAYRKEELYLLLRKFTVSKKYTQKEPLDINKDIFIRMDKYFDFEYGGVQITSDIIKELKLDFEREISDNDEGSDEWQIGLAGKVIVDAGYSKLFSRKLNEYLKAENSRLQVLKKEYTDEYKQNPKSKKLNELWKRLEDITKYGVRYMYTTRGKSNFYRHLRDCSQRDFDRRINSGEGKMKSGISIMDSEYGVRDILIPPQGQQTLRGLGG